MAKSRPGKLDQRVKILRRANTPDGMGGNDVVWNEIAEVWASAIPQTGTEITDYERVNSKGRYLFTIRYPADITESDRLEWQGVGFNIRFAAMPNSRDLYIDIIGERGVAQ